jgi:hypothetical protein
MGNNSVLKIEMDFYSFMFVVFSSIVEAWVVCIAVSSLFRYLANVTISNK